MNRVIDFYRIFSGSVLFAALLFVCGCSGGGGNTLALSKAPSSSTPSGPMAVSAVAGEKLVSLGWSSIDSASSYNVYRSLSSGATGTIVATPNTTSYTDGGLADGTVYYYSITAVTPSGESAHSSQVSATPYAPRSSITISGIVQYQDKEYSTAGFTGTVLTKAVRYATVELISANSSTPLYSTTTDSNGLYSILTATSSVGVYVRVYAESTPPGSPAHIQIKDQSPPPNLYSVGSVTFIPSGDVNVNMLVTASTLGGIFNMLDVFTNGFQFDAAMSNGTYPPDLTAYWQPNNCNGTYYCSAGGRCNEGIYVLNDPSGVCGNGPDTDEYDDDVLYHEFGHFTAAHFSRDDSPGGAHMLTNSDLDMRLAWSEGWGDSMPGNIKRWLNATGRQVLLSSAAGVSLTEYVDTVPGGLGIAFDMGNPGGPPYVYSCGEVAVAKILLDLNLNFGMQDVWSVLSDFRTLPPSTPVNLELFWDRWHSLPGTAAKNVDSIFANRLINYLVDDAFSASTYTVAISTPQSHSLYPAADGDVVSFGTNTGQHYTIITYNMLNGADTYVELYNNPLMISPITYDDNTSGFSSWAGYVPSHYYPGLIDYYSVHHDNGSDILGSSLGFTATSNGPYFVKVKSSASRPLSAGRYGSYTFRIITP